jgi:hypothetical protein
MTTTICSECGTENPDGRTDCVQCGATLPGTPELPSDVQRQEPAAQPDSDKKKPAVLEIIGGVVLFLIACPLFGVALAGPSANPYGYELGMAATTGIVAVIGDLFLVGGMYLILGSSRVSTVYFVNAVILAAVSLYAHPWTVVADVHKLRLLEPLAILPCLGTLLSGVLAIRRTRSKMVMRIASWVIAGIGGLTTILFVVELVILLI